ncbi:hypothetical protein GCM10011515_01810 [Tsuneonella deserti]|uniref:Cytochrome c domain-containing protein n=1 Tax=Tsuneonella deserti TaxID=2035528 RepID=A0ABQ1RYZ0_9SPHN|nr:c-type cytochrome [Tsuneonella deserti]GGD85809.1 hypothetical protein GCM10011515_01810 [Tsuneonella deserti]
MIRLAVGAVLLLSLAGCGKATRESDDPIPASSPEAANASASTAVAAASTAAAAETPAAFMQCKVCHTTEPDRNLIGPSLAGVYGRRAGSLAGYPYSTAIKQAGLTWDEGTLDTFLTSPMKAVPGTKMTYAGIKDPAARREVIAYLETL